jgi:hypothetical protein
MTATNDMVNLSRSNAISHLKADSSDLAVGLVTKKAYPPLPKRFYQTENVSIAYDTVEEISQWLVQRPQHIAGFQESMLGLAVGCSQWGAFRTMRDTLNFLVDVRIRVAELREERHLA